MNDPANSKTIPKKFPSGRYDFMGHIPVPLKYHFQGELKKMEEKHRRITGKRLNCYFAMGGGSQNYAFKSLHKIGSIDDFPGILLSSAFDNLFEKKFLKKYIGGEYFADCQKPLLPIYGDCGIKDAKNQFTIFAVAPIVMLIDREKLNGRPIPEKWDDILDPIYRKSVIFGGWRKDENSPFSEFNNFLLMTIHKEHGAEGLEALAENTKNLLHYVYMSRIAGTGGKDGAAIYIMPWFLADICPRREKTLIVWPRDGALAFPMYLLIKKTEIERLKILIDYLTGKKLGQYLADNCYPSLNPNVNYRYPPGAKLKWIGWNYIYSNNIPKLMEAASKIFFDRWNPLSQAKTKI